MMISVEEPLGQKSFNYVNSQHHHHYLVNSISTLSVYGTGAHGGTVQYPGDSRARCLKKISSRVLHSAYR